MKETTMSSQRVSCVAAGLLALVVSVPVIGQDLQQKLAQ
jgi:hypothetical protein